MEELLVPQEVTKVISAIDARRLYHDSELKREFCNSYDLFLMENVLKDSCDGFLGHLNTPLVVDFEVFVGTRREVCEIEENAEFGDINSKL